MNTKLIIDHPKMIEKRLHRFFDTPFDTTPYNRLLYPILTGFKYLLLPAMTGEYREHSLYFRLCQEHRANVMIIGEI